MALHRGRSTEEPCHQRSSHRTVPSRIRRTIGSAAGEQLFQASSRSSPYATPGSRCPCRPSRRTMPPAPDAPAGYWCRRDSCSPHLAQSRLARRAREEDDSKACLDRKQCAESVTLWPRLTSCIRIWRAMACHRIATRPHRQVPGQGRRCTRSGVKSPRGPLSSFFQLPFFSKGYPCSNSATAP